MGLKRGGWRVHQLLFRVRLYQPKISIILSNYKIKFIKIIWIKNYQIYWIN